MSTSMKMFQGVFLSSHIPNAAPSNAGTVTDQPTIPNIPKPNQTLCLFSRRAFNLRFSFSAICRLNLFASSLLDSFAFYSFRNFSGFPKMKFQVWSLPDLRLLAHTTPKVLFFTVSWSLPKSTPPIALRTTP